MRLLPLAGFFVLVACNQDRKAVDLGPVVQPDTAADEDSGDTSEDSGKHEEDSDEHEDGDEDGFSVEQGDCDDANADIRPGAEEVCDGVDQDCDGVIDDAASDAGTWYADQDRDAWGDSTSSVAACEAPAGHLSSGGDCDDTDAGTYPGAPERYDGLDNDCDGVVDDNAWAGTGADGTLRVSGVVNLSTDASGRRASADGVTHAVTALGADTVTLAGAADGLSVGDEVLLVNLQGSRTAHDSVGAYEFGWVASISSAGAAGETVTLESPIGRTYGAVSNANLSGQVIVLVRVPQYTEVAITATGLLTANAWNGASGGVLAFRATGMVNVAAGGTIAMNESGYAGGSTGSWYNLDAFQGESYGGVGQGDGTYNEYFGYWANNLGAGGAHVTGAGGNHGGGATSGVSWDGGYATPPEAGDTYGELDLSRLYLGSGGGGVWHGGADPGPGGGGGGIVYIGVSALTASGAGAITATGGTTTHWAIGSWTYGAGGGAGGSVWVIADTLLLAADAIDAQGGLGESTHIRAGGDGGFGRVRVDCVTVNRVGCTSASGATALEHAAEPDAAYVATP